MRFLRGLLFLLSRLLAAFLWGWASGIATLVRMLLALWRRLRARLAKPGRDRRTTDERCVAVRHPSLQRPDPLIYSQTYLMSLGLAVTWDNPDIQLYKGGTPVSSSDLQPATEYRVVARIWNSSTDAPVVGMPVRFTLHGFGVGTDGDPIGDAAVPVLGVKGGPHCPAFAEVTWTTPAAPGHYCIKAHLDWTDDANPNNNVGQENTNVVQTSSPVQTSFRLRNDDRERRRRYRFAVDTYALPERPPCRERRQEPRPQREPERERDAVAVGLVALPPDVVSRHRREAHPLPPGWSVRVDPEEVVLAPHQEREIAVVIDPPGDFHGSQKVNVHTFDDVGLAGGVTFVVERA